MNLPADLDKIITLYLYNELDAAEKRELETHLQFNEDSRTRLEELRAFHQLMDRKPVVEPTAALLEKSRLALRDRLREEQRKSSQRPWFGQLLDAVVAGRVLAPAGGAIAILLLGILIGRLSFPVVSKSAVEGSTSPTTSDTVISNIEKVEYEPNTGQVTVHYQTMQEVALRGNIQDAAIRNVLTHAIRDEQNPGRRLAAVKAMQKQTFSDTKLENALIYAMENDSVAGIRLLAAKALRQLPINDNIEISFIKILLKDPNPALRIAAVEALSKSQQEDVMSVFQNAARGDANDFVRLTASKALEKRNAMRQVSTQEGIKELKLNQ